MPDEHSGHALSGADRRVGEGRDGRDVSTDQHAAVVGRLLKDRGIDQRA